jgi:D-serine deaminase-like pyridoxal phosphate-dependent protein
LGTRPGRGERPQALSAPQTCIIEVAADHPLAFGEHRVVACGIVAERRAAVVAAVRNIAAGSGLYGPALFDTYQHFRPQPAAFFVLSVVRRPAPDIATVLGGGWIASGAAGPDRLPTPAWPTGLRLIATEGAGEVQTPLQGPGAHALRLGDRVWFRHAKAGELCEHVDQLHIVDGEHLRSVATYRGEGKTFL